MNESLDSCQDYQLFVATGFTDLYMNILVRHTLGKIPGSATADKQHIIETTIGASKIDPVHSMSVWLLRN
jgi:hypothetical protein